MPKNKRHKYERVRHLPNVTIVEADEPIDIENSLWHRRVDAGAQTILELGCGKGEYSLALAVANPNHRVVGIDYKSHRICVGAEKALARGLGNVHFVRTRVERLREFFRPHSIYEIWLTFPDPHLKNRKAKCRLTAAPFLDAYARVLVPGGRVHLKTDSLRLYQYTRGTVLRWGGRLVNPSEGLASSQEGGGFADHPVSAYERAALSRGAAIRMLTFTLNEAGE